MAKNVRNFVNRLFMQTVDLGLLRELLAPHEPDMAFKWLELPEDESAQRDALFHLFRERGDEFPDVLLDALHSILTLSTPNGARALQEIADERGVRLAEEAEPAPADDRKRLTARHLALIAYLHHRDIFQRAVHRHAFFASSPLRLIGARKGVVPRHEDETAREAFKAACREYFARRYQGRICDVYWYPESTHINLLVEHGMNAVILPVEEGGRQTTRPVREITADAICFEPETGLIKVAARAKVERLKLVHLFAEHLLDDPDFFSGPKSDQLYHLAPIEKKGTTWKFENDWDDDLKSVKVVEIEIDEGQAGKGGRGGSPWSLRMTDTLNSVSRVERVCPDIDLSTLRVSGLKMRMRFEIDGERRDVTVAIKVPNTVSFRDHLLEARIFEHLRLNGFLMDDDPARLAAAAD